MVGVINFDIDGEQTKFLSAYLVYSEYRIYRPNPSPSPTCTPIPQSEDPVPIPHAVDSKRANIHLHPVGNGGMDMLDATP